MLLRQFIPPVFFNLKNKLSSALHYEKEFNSFSDAEIHCGTYNNPELASHVRDKTLEYLKQIKLSIADRTTTQNLLVISHICNLLAAERKHGTPEVKLNVVEVGGACGAMYFTIRALLPHAIRKWSIAETQEMVKTARVHFQSDTLDFNTSYREALQSAGNPELGIASGVIQYLPDPGRFLKEFFTSGLRYIYISRISLLKNHTKQIICAEESDLQGHGISVKMQKTRIPEKKISVPVTYIPYDWLISQAELYRYEMLMEFDEGFEATFHLRQAKGIRKRFYGFLFRSKQ